MMWLVFTPFYHILPRDNSPVEDGVAPRLLTGSTAAFPKGRRKAVTGKWSWVRWEDPWENPWENLMRNEFLQWIIIGNVLLVK